MSAVKNQKEKQDQDVRQRLLEAAFMEIYQHGYQGTGLNQILEKTGLTKGALYHYFKSKKELAMTAYDEILNAFIDAYWVVPLSQEDADPLDVIIEQLNAVMGGIRLGGLFIEKRYGCPLNNLSQEMSPLDSDFSGLLEPIYNRWGKTIADALQKARDKGSIEKIDVDETAFFIIAVIEGCILTGKIDSAEEKFRSCIRQLGLYLESLRI